MAVAIGGSTDSGPETPVAHGSFTIRPAVGANVINLADLKTLVTDNFAGQIADARSAGRFAGTEQEPRAGLRPVTFPGHLMFQSVAYLKMARSRVEMTSLPLLPKEALILTVR